MRILTTLQQAIVDGLIAEMKMAGTVTPENEPSLRRCARAQLFQVAGFSGQEEKTYACPVCLDKGFTPPETYPAHGGEYERVRPCDCSIGIPLQAREWRRIIWPYGPKRPASEFGRQRWARFHAQHPAIGTTIQLYLDEHPEEP